MTLLIFEPIGQMSIVGLDRTQSVTESVQSPVQTDWVGPKSEEKPERSLYLGILFLLVSTTDLHVLVFRLLQKLPTVPSI